MSKEKNTNKAARNNSRSAFSVSACGAIKTRSGALPKRLQKRHEFLSVAGTNKKFVTSGFILQCGAPFNEDRHLRIGYTASRRVGGAVERNKVKRKLREIARLIFADNIDGGRDYVLVGRKAAIKRPLAIMLRDAEKLLIKMQQD